MEETDKDLRFITTGIEELPQYLSSSNLFWPLGQSATPLTIGNLLFTLRRLQSIPGQSSIVHELERKIEQERASNRALFQKKEQAEFSSRTREWGNSSEEWQENGLDRVTLVTELRNRTILDLLLADLQTASIKESLQIEKTDQFFKELTEPAGFVWEDSLQGVFPAEPFWYLWRAPLGRKK
ncbi:MAG: hypothetical protein VB013_09790 [Anaerolineaceae bacterium]|nr:hypothetical protein [Anaerolineaceae bacterium]